MKSADDGFLTMHEFGPWRIEKRGQMRELGILILALVYQSCELDLEKMKTELKG